MSRKAAILLALLSMWLVGGMSLGLMHSMQDWHFILLKGFDASTLGQIGGYFIARIGAQIPALALAAFIIAMSRVQHPIRAACFTALGFYGITTAIRLARRPWSLAPDLDQRVPVVAELVQLVLLVSLLTLFVRSCVWVTRRLEVDVKASP